MVAAGKALFHMRLVDCANRILHGEPDEDVQDSALVSIFLHKATPQELY